MAHDDIETATYTIESPNGDAEDLTVPAGVVDLIRENEEETAAEVLGDLATLSLTQQVHALVHHSPGNPGEEAQAYEEKALELFEERFGQSFEEMTGHSH